PALAPARHVVSPAGSRRARHARGAGIDRPDEHVDFVLAPTVSQNRHARVIQNTLRRFWCDTDKHARLFPTAANFGEREKSLNTVPARSVLHVTICQLARTSTQSKGVFHEDASCNGSSVCRSVLARRVCGQ